jgi:hypothetical protein
MYHTIEFAKEFWIDVEISPKHRLERLRVHKGTRVRARVKPYVVEAVDGPVEVSDLFFEDGTATRLLRCECFSFVDLDTGVENGEGGNPSPTLEDV